MIFLALADVTGRRTFYFLLQWLLLEANQDKHFSSFELFWLMSSVMLQVFSCYFYASSTGRISPSFIKRRNSTQERGPSQSQVCDLTTLSWALEFAVGFQSCGTIPAISPELGVSMGDPRGALVRVQWWRCTRNQRPWTRSVTHHNEHLLVKLTGQNGVLMTPRGPQFCQD